MKQIVVTGSLAFDYIMDFPGSYEDHILPDKIKTLSVSFRVQNLNRNFGGVAGNIAYNLRLLSQHATIFSSAGTNDFTSYQKHLEKIGVDTKAINLIPNEFTANAFIMTDKNNCQITGFFPGALNHDKKLSLKTMKNVPFVIIGPTTTTAMVRFVKEAKELSIPYLYDPAQHIPQLSKQELYEGIERADVVIGDDYEIALIIQRSGLSKDEIRKKAKILVTTLGSQGSVIETAEHRIPIGIVKPKAIVDPTGAGDAYIAGFIAGYTRQLPLQICGQLGATAATYAIEHYGTQNHSFTMKEFSDRYREAFGDVPKW